MLIGTAGHIDHGKTTLIGALTGVNTDRLPEEKRRGISIDLGYAYLPAPDGSSIGFIDVPGHERFVPAMLAGATGIDCALLVIAADDGPMPQTREHLDILNLLGIERLIVALTKIDRASDEQRAAANAAIRALLDGLPFANAPIYPVAAPTGTGIEALRAALFSLKADYPEFENTAPAPQFRLAIDRSFSVSGAGTVVTGTVHAGCVRVGDLLQLSKKSDVRRPELRVRALHANNQSAQAATRGLRCALNLSGIAHQDAERGDWVVSAAMHDASPRLDVELIALPDSEKLLRPGVDLHVHHGTQHLMGRLVPLDTAGGLVQLVLASPVLACHGDRLIIRDASAQRTLAGARVLDPQAPVRHRRTPVRLAQLAALRIREVNARFAALLEASPAGSGIKSFQQQHNATINPPSDAIILRDHNHVFSRHHLDALAGRISELLAGHHQRHPDEPGLERDRLRRFAAPHIDGRIFPTLLTHWLETGLLARSGALWHLPAHRVTLTEAERHCADRLLPVLLASPYDPPWLRNLAVQFDLEEPALRHLLKKLATQGETFQVVHDLFYHRDAIAQLARHMRTLAGHGATSQPIKAAALRDLIGGGRKRAIQILEFFDRVGYTRRIGKGQLQAHVIRGDAPVVFDRAGQDETLSASCQMTHG